MINLANKKILVTGGHGFLGCFIVEQLKDKQAIVYAPPLEEINLLNPEDCAKAIAGQEIIIHAAGKVGGIEANRTKPGEFFYENTLMGMHLLEAARIADIEKFVQVGSVCSYPKVIDHIPYRETDLWNGYPEETNGPYGLAKKALLTMGQAYRTQYSMNVIHLLQVNLYGPGDHFGVNASHVIPALIDRFWKARQAGQSEVICWGTGSPTREFLYVADAAAGIIKATEHYDSPDPINLGSGQEISIKDLAKQIATIIGYTGQISWDTSKPDGQPRRLFDDTLTKQALDFTPQVTFQEGITQTIAWYQENVATKQSIKKSPHAAEIK